jgi:phosphotransferase system enzyme I (PtsP)
MMGNRYDLLSPPLLKVLRMLATRCEAAGVPLSLCGEMASRPLEAMALIGCGFRTLSMSPPAVGEVKSMLRSLHVGDLADFMEGLYGLTDSSVRLRLKAFARDHGVLI